MSSPLPSRIPVIDLSPYFEGTPEGKQAVGAAVDAACRDLGFLVIQGHGIDPQLLERVCRVSHAFFDLPDADKQAIRIPADRYRGYIGMEAESLAASMGVDTPPDVKEGFNIGPVVHERGAYHSAPDAGSFFADNLWPEQLPEMAPAWEAYYAAMEDLAFHLMRIFAIGLGMPETYFDDKVDKHISNCSAMFYPPQHTPPKPGQLRAGAHTDYGSLTILYKDNAPGGLQVQTPSGDWIEAPDVPGAFVVNIGDLMQDWTNQRWKSTMHRVVNPTAAQNAMSRRLALPFFHQPNYDCVVECLPTCVSDNNPARLHKTTSGEHVTRKITQHQTAKHGQEAAVAML